MTADLIIIDDPWNEEPVCTTEQLIAWFDAAPALRLDRPSPPPMRLSADDVAAILAATSQPADENLAAVKPEADR